MRFEDAGPPAHPCCLGNPIKIDHILREMDSAVNPPMVAIYIPHKGDFQGYFPQGSMPQKNKPIAYFTSAAEGSNQTEAGKPLIVSGTGNRHSAWDSICAMETEVSIP